MSTIVDEAPGSVRPFTITVTMDGGGSDALMRLVSVFHRRQLEILQSSYERVASTRWMVVKVEATDERVRTTALTLRNTIGVIGCEVAPDPGGPSTGELHAHATEYDRTPALHAGA